VSEFGECGRHLWRATDPDEACPACIDETMFGRPEMLREEDYRCGPSVADELAGAAAQEGE
jgi:hypothetical protein